MYTDDIRRIQIYIDEDLDERLKIEAASTRRSKAALIRESVAERFGKKGSLEADPITSLVGSIDVEPGDIDEVVYGA